MRENREREEFNVIMKSSPKNTTTTTKPKPIFLINKTITIESPLSFKIMTENEVESECEAKAKVAKLKEDDNGEFLDGENKAISLMDGINSTRLSITWLQAEEDSKSNTSISSKHFREEKQIDLLDNSDIRDNEYDKFKVDEKEKN